MADPSTADVQAELKEYLNSKNINRCVQACLSRFVAFHKMKIDTMKIRRSYHSLSYIRSITCVRVYIPVPSKSWIDYSSCLARIQDGLIAVYICDHHGLMAASSFRSSSDCLSRNQITQSGSSSSIWPRGIQMKRGQQSLATPPVNGQDLWRATLQQHPGEIRYVTYREVWTIFK